jgi:hypothetical protein
MTMSRTAPSKLLGLAAIAAVLAGCSAEDDLLDDESAAIADGSGAADLIDIDGLTLLAPPPGMSVWAERLFDDGTMQAVMLHTDLAGVVYVEELGDDERPTELAAPAPDPLLATAACSDGAYNLNSYKWNQTLKWAFNSGSTPTGLNVDSVEAALKAGMSNITGSDNSCSLSDAVSATHQYLGRKSIGVGISSSGSCTTNDGVNMVGFGDLPAGTLGVACTWSINGVAVESDIRFNKADHKWTTSPGSATCSNRFSVEAVMTHEAGHAFGLGHVSESTHGNLTMSTQIGPCQNKESTLGRGDVLGLRARY